MNEKVMIIGLDGATWGLLHPWISNNKLPTFKKLVDLGSKGILKSTIPCTTSPALPSLFTGMNPGNHGIFSFLKPSGSPVTVQNIGYPTIWNILDKYNYRSCIVNVRCTFPPEKLCGLMISGSVPSDKSNYTYPEDLKERIEGFRDDRILEKIFELRNKKKNKKYRKDLLELIIKQTERRYKIFKKLNQETDYDFSIFWIEETDLIQHCCWEYKKTLLQFYLNVDSILNDILLSFPNTNFFIVSDHGFESSPKKYFFVNTWLYKEGYLKQVSGSFLRRFINFAQFFAYKYVHPQRLGRVLNLLQSVKLRQASDQQCAMDRLDNFPGIDKNNSVAYLATLYGIDVNDSDNYEANREEIIGKLEKMEDEERERIMRGVWKREEIYMGKYLKEIPDIIFLTSEKYMPFPTLTENLFGEIKRNVLPWQSGEHYRARDGILIASGPVIRRKNYLGNVMIEDVAPTILHLMGCGIPENVDGKVLTNMFKRDSDPAKRKPLSKKYYYIAKEIRLERKEKEKIRERLRKLGYL